MKSGEGHAVMPHGMMGIPGFKGLMGLLKGTFFKHYQINSALLDYVCVGVLMSVCVCVREIERVRVRGLCVCL